MTVLLNISIIVLSFVTLFAVYKKYYVDFLFWLKFGCPFPDSKNIEKMTKAKARKRLSSIPPKDLTIRNKFYYLKFTKNEEWLVNTGVISEDNVRNWHCILERNLSYKEQKIIEVCSNNGIKINYKDFKNESVADEILKLIS